MDLNDLARTSGEWFRGSGPESDIVISSRIRLARNLADFPFISRASQQDRTDIEACAARSRAAGANGSLDGGDFKYLNVNELKVIDRQFLVERQLISREHAESEGARGVAIDRREQVSLMVNEEDHCAFRSCTAGWTWKMPGTRSTASTPFCPST